MSEVMGYPAQEGRVGYVVVRGKVERRGEPTYVLVRKCPFCHQRAQVTVPAQGLWDWEHGRFAQDAFPTLSVEEREIVMTGIHQACWDEGLGPEPVEATEESLGKGKFDDVPEGWTRQTSVEDEWLPAYTYITKDDGSLGEHGMVGYDADRGGYLIPGASEAFQGPFDTLAEAVAAAEGNAP